MKTTLTIAVVTTLSAVASAQTAPAPGPSASLSTQALMQANEGSLLQASASPPSVTPTPFKAANVGFYTVPEPEPHVLKKHDLVNIVVREESTSHSGGATDLQKAADLDAKVDAFVKLSAARFSVIGGAEGVHPPELKLEGTRDFKGTGTVDRSDSVTLRLEAEVIDVKPNKTLVIQATRHLKTDEEEVSVTLTGVCRVEDVDAANSVLSTDLHDLDLNKVTKGAVHDNARRGLLPRLLDFVNPF